MLTNRHTSQVFFHFMQFVQRTYETNVSLLPRHMIYKPNPWQIIWNFYCNFVFVLSPMTDGQK
jgi:hypothetical protein